MGLIHSTVIKCDVKGCEHATRGSARNGFTYVSWGASEVTEDQIGRAYFCPLHFDEFQRLLNEPAAAAETDGGMTL